MILLDLIVLAVTSLSVLFDVRVRRIPNWLILFGLGAGLIVNFYRGSNQFSYSVIGFVAGIGTFIVPFALGFVGAGDVKYFGVIGAILGVKWLPRVLFYSSIAAGTIAVVALLLGRCRTGLFRSTFMECKIAALSFGRLLPESVNARIAKGAYSLPWGVALSVGTILSYFVDPIGYWAGF